MTEQMIISRLYFMPESLKQEVLNYIVYLTLPMKNFFRAVVIIVLFAIVVGVGRSVYNQTSKFQEIYDAEGKAGQLQKENKKLKLALEEGKSNFSLERRARDKLGFQKPGDVLYVTIEKDKASKQDEESKKLANWQSWLNLLFR